MAISSKIGSVQDALLALLQGLSGLSDLQAKGAIALGYVQNPLAEQVTIPGTVRNWRQEFVLSGAGGNQKMESFEQPVSVSVSQSGTYQACRDRALELAAAIQEALTGTTNALTLSGAAYMVECSGGEIGEWVDSERRGVDVELLVSVRTTLP